MANELRCKLCGNADVKFQFSEEIGGVGYSSYYCRNCDLYQTLGEIAAVSPDYVGLTEEELVGEHVFLQRAHKRPAFEEWLASAKRNDPGFARGERRALLDIGCGIGGFLDFAKENGLDIYGFDASEAQISVARRNHANVRHAISIDDYMSNFSKNVKFDFITMWDVFEHIREPKTLLDSVRPHMTGNGLFFVSVPSGGAIPLKLLFSRLRKSEPGLIPWEHVFYYTKKSLPRVFKNSKYDVVDINGVVPYVRSMSAHEFIRRLIHRGLRTTPLALQIFAFARPKKG